MVRVTGIVIAVSSGASDNGDLSASATTSAYDDKPVGTGSNHGARWACSLIRPVRPPGGLTLKTLADAGAYILDLPEDIKQRRSWQRATDLLLKAASGAASVEDATAQIEQALFME
jgi:hypothetical protein